MTTRERLTAVEKRILTALLAVIDAAKDTVKFEDVHKILPFATRVAAGSNFNHIVVDSILAGDHIDRQYGDTLCGRRAGRLEDWIYGGDGSNCPGCLAIAQSIAGRMTGTEATELLEQFS